MEHRLRTPLKDEDVAKLRVGDTVYISGTLVTARDATHMLLLDMVRRGERPPIDLRGLALYHAGPVVKKVDGEWKVLACGPTTSMRMEAFEAEFLEATGIKLVIGKGGMGKRTADAMRRLVAAYAVFPGGAAVLAAEAIKRVAGVYFLEELGIPEAMWVFEVEDFGPLTVIIDPTGSNFYDSVRERAGRAIEEILKG